MNAIENEELEQQERLMALTRMEVEVLHDHVNQWEMRTDEAASARDESIRSICSQNTSSTRDQRMTVCSYAGLRFEILAKH